MKKWDHLKRNIKRLQGLYLLALVLLLSGCGKVGNTDTWVVEVYVVEKETVTREDKDTGTEEVFLLDCEDASGGTQVFELTDTALDGKYEAEKAFKELKTGKYYKFRVGWRGPGIEGRSGHHPSIYGAVKMEGFNLEYLPNNIDDGSQAAGASEEALQLGEGQQAEESSRSGEDRQAEESSQEDIEAKLEESFAAEKESLAKEQESLEEKLRELEQELRRLESAAE